MNLKGQWVWVTGASSGLGLAMSKQLAKRGANLLITARRVDRLETLAVELRAAGVEVKVAAADMISPADVEKVLGVAKSLPLVAAVLNAGVTFLGHFHELPWEAFEVMLQTNVVSTTRLTTELVKHFQSTGRGGRVMIVSSLTGLVPVPYQAAYSGTKAYLVAFGTALAHELKGTNVKVSVFAPGGIATEQTAGEGFNALRGWLASAEDVAIEAMGALEVSRPLHIQGFMYRGLLLLTRLVPRDLSIWAVSREYRKSLMKVSKK